MFDQTKIESARKTVDYKRLIAAVKDPPQEFSGYHRFDQQPGGQHLELLTSATWLYTLRSYLRGKMHMTKKRVPMCVSGGATIIEVTPEENERMALKLLEQFSHESSA